MIYGCSEASHTAEPPDAAEGGPGLDAAADGPVADASLEADASSTPFTKPTPFAVALSATGPDQLQSVVAGPNGTFYAAGFAAATADGARAIVIVRMTTTGLDPTFGANGIAKTPLEFVGGSDEIDVAVQPSGKVLVSATIANANVTGDRDVAVARLDATGALDPTFGVAGVRVLDLGTALDATQSAQRDSARAIAVDASGAIFVHAATRGDGTRTDSDFAIVKLGVDGAVDTTFGVAGRRTLDFGTPSANATPRGIQVLADGSVVAAGYSSSSLTGNTTQPVLYKLTPAGAFDASFADNGVVHTVVLTLQTEAYGIAVQGTRLVTGGYGRNTGTTNDWVSLRFDTKTGARDLGWGKVPNGTVMIDPSGTSLGSNCRGAFAFSNGKTLLLGSTGPANATAQDAALAILDEDGVLDAKYGSGIHTFAFGSGQGGADQLWSAAVSGGHVLAIGWRGAGATQTEQVNDDAWALSFPIQ